MKVIALLALAGSAAAFAPAQQSRASTSVAAFENDVGVTAPVSDNDLFVITTTDLRRGIDGV